MCNMYKEKRNFKAICIFLSSLHTYIYILERIRIHNVDNWCSTIAREQKEPCKVVGSCYKAGKSNHDCLVYILFFFDHALERRTCTKMRKKLITRYVTIAKQTYMMMKDEERV
jgi:hypothetical protein